MIKRKIEKEIKILTNEFPIIAILGPRQSGKTTLAKNLFHHYTYVSFEDIDNRDDKHTSIKYGRIKDILKINSNLYQY